MINVLGTNYKIFMRNEEEEPRLKENWGFTDFHTKEIFIRDDIEEEKENGMYLCDKKHSKILLDYIQQKENIIKEVREFAKLKKEMYEKQENVVGQEAIISLLEILDKGE